MPCSQRNAYAAAAAIGVLAVLVVHGPGFVFGASSYWDMPSLVDHRMYAMGYRYFAHQPWGAMFDIPTNLPLAKSVAFSDLPLLWAVICKALGLGAGAFLGLWYALASALQAVCGVACLRALGRRDWTSTIAGALCFLAMPAFTYRFPHAALSGHFVVLWAFALYLRRASPRAWMLLLAIAALLNVYLTVMALALFVAARHWRWLPVALAIIAGELALAGYFSAEATVVLPTFSASGANLLGAVLPMDSGFVGDRLWTDTTGFQYEGVCYLGAGVLVLAVLAARAARDALRRHRALAIILAAAALFALSNHLYLGAHRLVAYPIPHLVHWIPEQFRCPGRFSWLPMYAVAIFALSRVHPRWLLVGATLAQLVDVSPDWRRWRGYTEAPASSHDLRSILARVDRVEVAPAHDCNSDRDWEHATQIEYLASERALPINGIYTARPHRDCDADALAMLDFHPRAGTLYVFVAPMVARAQRLALDGLPCAAFAFGAACATDANVLAGLPALPPLPAYAPITVTDAPYLQVGWASSQADGRWTIGPVAALAWRSVEPPAQPKLHVEGSAIECATRPTVTVDAFIGATKIGEATWSSVTSVTTFAVDRALLATPVVDLSLRPRDFRTRSQLGCKRSDLELTLKVREIWID